MPFECREMILGSHANILCGHIDGAWQSFFSKHTVVYDGPFVFLVHEQRIPLPLIVVASIFILVIFFVEYGAVVVKETVVGQAMKSVCEKDGVWTGDESAYSLCPKRTDRTNNAGPLFLLCNEIDCSANGS